MPDENINHANRQADPPQAQLPPAFLHDLIRDIINRHDAFVNAQGAHCNATHAGVADVIRKQDEVIKQQTIKLIKLEETITTSLITYGNRIEKVEGKVKWFTGVGWWVATLIGAVIATLCNNYLIPLIMDKLIK